MTGLSSPIDESTSESAETIKANNGETWDLMFSDEFNEDGRTFYPGDDPYWESIELHAWGTNDLEWYDHRQLSTKDGKLVLELAEIKKNDLDYLGASLQSWNKVRLALLDFFCCDLNLTISFCFCRCSSASLATVD